MSQAEIGNLRVRLGIDTAEFTNGVRSVQGSLGTLTSAMKGFAAAFSAGMIFDASVSAVKAVAEIGDVAESIGVSAEQLQAFNKMAVASGASTDVLRRGLQSIAEQSVDSESKLAKLFEANGLVTKGRETNQIIREFMDLVKNAASPTEQLAIITGVLGDKVGRELVEAFRDGAAGADEATKQMVASGEFHTNAEVKRLQEIETEYHKVTDRIATYWQKMIVGIAGGISQMQADFSSGKPSAASELWNWMTGKPVQDWDINTGQLLGPSRSTATSLGPIGLGSMTGGGAKPTVLPPTSSPKASGSIKTAKETLIPPGTIEDIYGAGKAVSALQANFQEAQWGAGAFSDSLMQIGDSIESGLSSALSGLISGTMSVKDAFASMAQSIIQTMADLAAQLAINAGFKILMAALGGGGGAGFNIGGMTFGGLYANGGTLGAGQWGIAGEAGPEVIHGPARITPMDKMGGGGQMSVTVNNYAGADVRTRQGMDGAMQIDILKAEIAKDLSRGGNLISQAVESGYGLRRAGR